MVDGRKEYTVLIGGRPHRLLLDEQDASRLGDEAQPVKGKESPKPANKARTARDK